MMRESVMDRSAVAGDRSVIFSGSDRGQLDEALQKFNPSVSLLSCGAESFSFGARVAQVGYITSLSLQCTGEATLLHTGAARAIFVLLPISGLSALDFGNGRILCQPSCGAIFDGMAPHHAYLSSAPANCVVQIPHDELTKRLSFRLERSIKGAIGFSPQLDLSEGAGLALKQIGAMLNSKTTREAFELAPLAAANLSETVIELMLGAVEHRFSGDIVQSKAVALPRHVKRAIEYMEANLSKSITIDDLASYSGVSVRALQIAFQEFRRTSPTGYLRDLRLKCVHDELLELNGTATVRKVALKWGFSHMGRFSADYRKRFGELPSKIHLDRSIIVAD